MEKLRLDPLLLEEFALDPWELLTVAAGINASLSQTLGATTLSAAANDPVNLTLSKALGATTVAATATAPKADATLSQTLGATTVAATATDPVAASLSGTLGATAVTATATAPDAAALSATLGATTLAADATIGNAAADAALDVTLGAVSVSATATDPLAASVDATLGAVGIASTATVPDAATLSATLGDVTLAATFTNQDVALASLDQALGAVSVGATATDPVAASLSETLGDVTASSTLTTNRNATLAATLDPVGVAATAAAPVDAALAATLDAVTSNALAQIVQNAQLAATLGEVAITARAIAFTPQLLPEAPLTGARPSTSVAVAARSGAHRLVAGRATPLTVSALRSTAQLTAARPAAGEIVVCRLGDSIMAALRKSRGRKPTPVTRTARLTNTLGPVSLDASATESAPVANNASLTRTLSPMALHASGAATTREAAAAIELGTTALTAFLTTGSVPTSREATLSATLAPASLGATATTPDSADAAVAGMLGPVSLAATAKNKLSAAVSKTLGAVSLHAGAHFPLSAQLSKVLGAITGAATAYAGRNIGTAVVTANASHGDGVTDATTYLQGLINGLPAGGGTLIIPPGVSGPYMIDTTRISGGGGLALRSNFRLQFQAGAQLKAKTNSQPRDYILLARNLHDVEIVGAGSTYWHLLGDLSTFVPSSTTTTDEWGHGGAIYNCQRVTVRDLGVRECVGDGFSTSGCTDVVFQWVNSQYNRRQGLSVVGVDGLLVEDCEFSHTKGTSPECGIDVEPENTICQNLTFRRVRCRNNNKFGLLLLRRTTAQARIVNVTVEDCELDTNVSLGFQCKGPEGVTFRRNNVHDNGSEGAWVDGGSAFVGSENTFHNNYTKNGANPLRSFDLTGTDSRTATDWVLRNFPADSAIGLNSYR